MDTAFPVTADVVVTCFSMVIVVLVTVKGLGVSASDAVTAPALVTDEA